MDRLDTCIKTKTELQESDKDPWMILELMVWNIFGTLASIGVLSLYLYLVGVGAGVLLVGMTFYHVALLFSRWRCWIIQS